MSDPNYTTSGAPKRNRPSRRPPQPASDTSPTTLSEEFMGLALAFGNTLLFIGYEVNGEVEIVVYPRYRFSSDDRVQGHLGYVRAPFGTPWEVILAKVEAIFNAAHENYRLAVTLRSSEMRAHGSKFETAYDTITGIFRECWHGFSLKLLREGELTKEGMRFEGSPSGPVLVEWQGRPYTVQVFPTGSITMVIGDKRESLV